MTPKGQTRDLNTLTEPNIFKTAGDAILATIANYIDSRIWCEEVRSALLATAWLLVHVLDLHLKFLRFCSLLFSSFKARKQPIAGSISA